MHACMHACRNNLANDVGMHEHVCEFNNVYIYARCHVYIPAHICIDIRIIYSQKTKVCVQQCFAKMTIIGSLSRAAGASNL